MHNDIMEPLETRACDITMGIMKEKIHDRQTCRIYLLGTLVDIEGKEGVI